MASSLLMNCSVVLPDTNAVGSIAVEDGRIKRITNQKTFADEYFDLGYLTVFPGFIDIHNHGAVGVDVNTADVDGFHAVSEFLIKKGVTGWVPTLVPDAVGVYERTVKALETWRSKIAAKCAARVVGVHYEGIFANKVYCGALRPEYFREFTGTEIDDLPRLTEAKHIMTLAPEINGGIELVEKLAEQNWVISLGHTMADYDTLERAVGAGASHLTHFFNAMTGLEHRDPGVALWGLINKDVTFDIIADGIHVNPLMLKFAIAIKSPDRVSLISDSVAPTGLGDGEFELWGNPLTVTNGVTANAEGTLSGSVITVYDAFNRMRALGFTDQEVANMTSLNPARILGIDGECGSLEVNKRADIVAVDKTGEIRFVMLEGKVVYSDI
ncbi:MAG: N-acetylglucosamine-6-phosphate deacetylase [Pyrinomonadaceae bacterium]